ncbi:BRCA1 associated protein [Naegleria gruberi]|uniref:BRCA1 associated protein n=1 Tax=Naegleria gruberi TaxID=5762 RepID=D2VY05_NAEGR|nr:BRCA1 associated protein [Naegleria gruberi]EFC38281.1 BRCA1 associated protein [Naegleria gruberi]|eukprot:XP_002671025.1 BRCA1 associated protein [Naegleria gruberi strain NEG-M]
MLSTNKTNSSSSSSSSDKKKKKNKKKEAVQSSSASASSSSSTTTTQTLDINALSQSTKEELIENYYEPKHIFFSSGNPNVELITGIIKLYKHGTPRSFTNAVNENIQGDDFNTVPRSAEKRPMASNLLNVVDSVNNSAISEEGPSEDELFGLMSGMEQDELPEERSRLVSILAVPSFISIADFFEFIACFECNIEKTRILRDESPNKYMVLLQFDEQRNADSFFVQYNGRPFNSLDPEHCKIVFVKSVEFTSRPDMMGSHLDIQSSKDMFIVGSCNDPQLHTGSNATSPNTNTETQCTEPECKDHGHSEDEKRYELPTCPVCLDRLDSGASGIITTVCNHQFHCNCLTKWGDGNCPVCRYTEQITTELKCGECGCESNLWICLTCGVVGCGRYEKGHAMEHFLQTNHTYAMEHNSQRVWDYTGDGYVHRLVAGNTEGKLIEISHPNQKEAMREATELLEAQYNSKLDSFLNEYNQLLSQQLTSQRVYFENKLAGLEKDKDKQIESLINELQTYRQNTQKMTNKVQKTQKKAEKEKEETEFLKELNKTLINNQKQYEIKIEKSEENYKKLLEKKDAKIRDLEEQVQDMMSHFSTQDQIEKNPEMKNATIRAIGGQSSSGSSSDKPKKKKK